MTFEYFDIPFRYNETFINLLFQDPYTLFVFWDISDQDEEKFLNKYGSNLYNSSKLILKVSNLTTENTFEIQVDPFAKSWYINIDEPNSKYMVEIFRVIDNNMILVGYSNILSVPTDRINYNIESEIKFVNRYTNNIEYVIKFEEYIKSMKQIEIYNNVLNNNKLLSTISYILSNPSSFENISSGTRYNYNKEDGK